jgi:hypothetical protein
MAYGFGGGSVALEKDHTRAILEGVRSNAPLYVNSLPEQGRLLEKESFISSQEPTNKSKAEAPHLVVVRTGIRQTFWMPGLTAEALPWELIQNFPEKVQPGRNHYEGCSNPKTPIYLLIRNLRI